MRVELISEIAQRAEVLFLAHGVRRPRLAFIMDISLCDKACPLDGNKLLEFDDANFAHDIGGIARHLNHDTGELEDCFLPRCAR